MDDERQLQPAGAMPLPGLEDAGRPERPAWPAWIGLVGVLALIVATGLLAAIVGIVYAAAGVDDPDDSSSIDFALIAVQNIAFVAVPLIMTALVGRPTLRQFGFRGFKPSALGWAVLALFAYFVLSAIYVVIASPPEDDLPQELGADESTALAIVTGVFVIAVAPPFEEFFFRGFLYQALRNRAGVIGGALASGFIFGLIHLKFEFLVPLVVLGTVLALLFEKTNSLWPCIFVHAVNNALAFSVTV